MDAYKVDSWDKACIVFSDWMSDIEFMVDEKVDNDMKIRYNALAYVVDAIKKEGGDKNEPRRRSEKDSISDL